LLTGWRRSRKARPYSTPGKEGQSPKGAEKLGEALRKPDEMQTPKAKAHEEARAETPLKEKGQNHGGQKAKGKRRKGKG